MSKDSSSNAIQYRVALKAIVVTVLVYFAGAFGSVLFVKLLMTIFGLTLTFKDNPAMTSGLYIFSSGCMISVLHLFMRYTKTTYKSLLLQKPALQDLGYAFLGFGAYFIFAQIAYALIKIFLPSINLDQAQDLGIGHVSGLALVVVFVAIVIAPAITEELLFRGFLWQKLNQAKLSKLVSALIVSALFGLAHMQLNVSIDTFILSMVMLFVLQERRSLWATIGIHFIKNSLAFLAIFILKLT